MHYNKKNHMGCRGYLFQQEKGRALPKFGEWDVNNPASAEGFTVIFNKARDDKKTNISTPSVVKVNTPQKITENNHPQKKVETHHKVYYLAYHKKQKLYIQFNHAKPIMHVFILFII